ncbi:MAG: hypothetical protein NZ936_17285, partial [Alphaproteobacteria bacterium]|nr:hypothetical protein [Alphaproteobacteria bacterium]
SASPVSYIKSGSRELLSFGLADWSCGDCIQIRGECGDAIPLKDCQSKATQSVSGKIRKMNIAITYKDGINGLYC